jgi:hypothetical protein
MHVEQPRRCEHTGQQQSDNPKNPLQRRNPMSDLEQIITQVQSKVFEAVASDLASRYQTRGRAGIPLKGDMGSPTVTPSPGKSYRISR